MSNLVTFRLGKKDEPMGTLRGGVTQISPVARILTDKGFKWIRYIRTESTAFVEKQNEDFDSKDVYRHGRIEKIPIVHNNITFDKDEDPCLYEYLTLYPAFEGNNQKYSGVLPYFLEDLEADAREDLEYAELVAKALSGIVTLDNEGAIKLAMILGRLSQDQRKFVTPTKVKAMLVDIAQEDPEEILDALEDELRKEKELVLEALDKGILKYANPSQTRIDHANGDKFAENVYGHDALLDGAKIIANSPEKRDALKLAIGYGSTTDMDFKTQLEKDAPVAKGILSEELDINSEEDLVDFLFDNDEYKAHFSYFFKEHGRYKKIVRNGKDIVAKPKSKQGGKAGTIDFLKENPKEFDYLAVQVANVIESKKE